jgi:uncharacterized protein (TIGR02145 family)
MKNVIKTVLFGIMSSGSLVGSAQEFTVSCAASYTVGSVQDAEGAISYRWLEDNVIICGATASSYVNAEGKYPGEYVYVRQAYMPDCEAWVSSNEFKVRVTGAEATFEAFDPGSAPSSATGTRWCLSDQRDDKIYRVVMMPDGRVWMAQNLNYQKGLTFNERSDMANGQPFTTAGSGSATIGSYWCPGVLGDQVSTKEGCDIWGGALYAWETAMSLDGKVSGSWSDGTSSYTASGNASAMTHNHGRADEAGATTGGRGICPPGWHVPTDAEWGLLLDKMEDSGSAHSGSGTGLIGAVAGKNAKATATCASGSGNCTTDTDPSWQYNSSTVGEDTYGFRVLPAGYRSFNGSTLTNRGVGAHYWSSSAVSAANAWYRTFYYNEARANRANNTRSYGFSVRCVRG